jgi:hypothetical protein
MAFASNIGATNSLTSSPMNAVNITENNTTAPNDFAHNLPWTGTDSGGPKDTALCSDWTTSASGTGECGSDGSTSSTWTQNMALSCGFVCSLYCFEL